MAAVGLAGFTLGWWMSGRDRLDHAAPAVSTAPENATGTNLIAIAAADPTNDGDLPQLRLTPRAAALMQIEVRPVEARRVQVPVRLYGRIGYDETRLLTISAWVPGRLERLHVNFTGASVRRGQQMLEIYSPELIATQEEYLQASRMASEAGGVTDSLGGAMQLTMKASHRRLRLLGMDEEQIKRLERQGRVDESFVISAPLSGIVIERLASPGDYVETGQAIYRIADMSHLWVQLEVYESDLQWLESGQLAFFITQSYPGERFEGKVTFIDPIMNERTRTVGVRVDVPNPDGRLKPGMFVRGVIHAEFPNDAREGPAAHDAGRPLVIPVTAPLITGERAVVYVQLPVKEPTYEPRDVLLGPRAGEWYIVREGLSEGELVVTHGGFKIDSELQIRGRPSMMQPEGGPPPIHDHGDTAAPPAKAADPHKGH
jgi:membrane fusion protein, copper/silver efflux system